jgi:hypothetical protein
MSGRNVRIFVFFTAPIVAGYVIMKMTASQGKSLKTLVSETSGSIISTVAS